jgi:hypothetical protein
MYGCGCTYVWMYVQGFFIGRRVYVCFVACVRFFVFCFVLFFGCVCVSVCMCAGIQVYPCARSCAQSSTTLLACEK